MIKVHIFRRDVTQVNPASKVTCTQVRYEAPYQLEMTTMTVVSPGIWEIIRSPTTYTDLSSSKCGTQKTKSRKSSHSVKLQNNVIY